MVGSPNFDRYLAPGVSERLQIQESDESND